MKRLSVIIPGYKTPEKWWRRCLTSVRAACGPDDEILCVDDGSPVRPSFLEELAKEDARIHVLFLPQNKGQSAARNAALKIARGEYVTFVDSDDEVCGDIYRICLNQLRLDGADVAVFGVRVIWTGIRLYKDDMVPGSHRGQLTNDVAERLYRGCLLEYPVNKIYRRSFLEENEILLPEGLCPGEDTIFILKVVRAKAVWTFVNAIGYVYYRYDGSSLSRYLPTNLEATRCRADLWKEVFLFAHDECTEAENLKSEWENIWRRDSPVSYLSRYRFARKYGYGFVGMLVKSLCRRFLYVRLVRKFKVRRMFPSVREWKEIER